MYIQVSEQRPLEEDLPEGITPRERIQRASYCTTYKDGSLEIVVPQDVVWSVIDDLEEKMEYLKWFRVNCDFGPAHGDVIDILNAQFKKETGKDLPKGWGDEE